METSFGLQLILSISGQEAIMANFEYIEIEHVLNGILKFAELDDREVQVLAQIPDIVRAILEEKKILINSLKEMGIKVPEVSKVLRRKIRKEKGLGPYISIGRKKIHRSPETKEIFKKAEEYALKENSTYCNLTHLIKVISDFPSDLLVKISNEPGFYLKLTPKSNIKEEKNNPSSKDDNKKISITDMIADFKNLRSLLLSKIFGQTNGIHMFIEGLYNAEVLSMVDEDRKRPLAVFVFAGPPGVGKTFMAELAGSFLKRPFRRFDMTGYSDHQQHMLLTGFDPSYRGAQPGILTGFVKENPKAFLLFDEIEKAHLNTIQLFYQILDSGRLEDNFLKKDVNFRDTVIIFTTNAGKSLYDNPNKIGINAANLNYHKKTILSALLSEKNPVSGQPSFPQAICSRLGQGYPVMFNHLGINELEHISETALEATELLFEKQYKKKSGHNPLLSILMVIREGGIVDARQLKSETEKFMKTEIFKFCSLYDKDNLEKAFNDFDNIYFDIDKKDNSSSEVLNLYDYNDKAKVLLVGDKLLYDVYSKYVPEIHWFCSSSSEEVSDLLAGEDINMVLLDLWIKNEKENSPHESIQLKTISQNQDYIPLSARELDEGRKILRRIHERFPEVPVYLLSMIDSEEENKDDNYEDMTKVITMIEDGEKEGDFIRISRPIDDELFLACVRSGGARGILETNFFNISGGRDWLLRRNQFAINIQEINRRIWREKKVGLLAQEHRVLNFDTVSLLDKDNRTLLIKLRNFSVSRAIDASDSGGLIEDVERPEIKFDDVIGATSAKEALTFIVNWLKSPKRYKAFGLRPPRGILLTGPPGTGKTMLARALAGESKCAFIETSATNFVTIWQGSGPQNVRNLFSRARRYAPSIIFIDEIDSIGRKRSASPGGAGRAEEGTLNSLLTEMDGFASPSSQPVIVIAATNLSEQLDGALKRRFDREIEVDCPDKDARLLYLKKSLSKRTISKISEELIERIAGQSAGNTIADLERILQEAGVMAVQRSVELTDEILEEAFEKFRHGEAGPVHNPEVMKRIARHEAGHTIITWSGGNIPLQVTIIGRGNMGGFMERESNENKIIYTKPELEQKICEAMGGRASEIIYYGEEYGLSTGVSGDLEQATHIAEIMTVKYGMNNDYPMIYTDKYKHENSLSDFQKSLEKVVKLQLEKAINILKQNRKYLDLLSEKLLEKNRLLRSEIEEILKPVND